VDKFTIKNPIKSAAVKLTLSYLAIIMLLSVGFSVFVYHISDLELSHSLRRPIPFFNRYSPDFTSYLNLRSDELTEGRNHLKDNLLLFNLATLVTGGAISYLLARRTLEPIEAALEAQTRFTADASHELRTPLTAMQTEIEVALRNPKLSADEARTQLQSNLEEVAKLRSLSNGLLLLASTDGKNIEMAPVELAEVTKTAVTRLRTLAQDKHITIKTELGDHNLRALADADSLVELLVLLVDNAIKYSPPRTTIAIQAAQHGKHVELVVRDQGRGISRIDLPHVFERFYRADQSRTKDQAASTIQAEGYGLGLSIAQKIAEMLQGDIAVKSTVGKGSTFTVTLPVAT